MKVLVSDYDKTFYTSKESIEKNKKAVKDFRKNGNLFIFSTGRSYYDMKPQIDKYELEYDYLIIDHGATILDNKGNILYTFKLNMNIVPELIKDLKIEDYKINQWKEKIGKDLYNIYFCCNELEGRLNYKNNELGKIAVKYNTDVDVAAIKDFIDNKYKNINSYRVSHSLIEITSNETSKSKSIEVLRKKLNINKEDIYTVGDGYSDIEMIENYNGYAMIDCVKPLEESKVKKVSSVAKLIKDIEKKDE